MAAPPAAYGCAVATAEDVRAATTEDGRAVAATKDGRPAATAYGRPAAPDGCATAASGSGGGRQRVSAGRPVLIC